MSTKVKKNPNDFIKSWKNRIALDIKFYKQSLHRAKRHNVWSDCVKYRAKLDIVLAYKDALHEIINAQ